MADQRNSFMQRSEFCKINRTIVLIILLSVLIACSKPAEEKEQAKAAQPSVVATEKDDEQRKTFHAEMQTHLNQDNFSELDRIARELTATKERFPGGDWKLDRFYDAVGSPPGGPAPVAEQVDYKDRIVKLTKWTAQMPDSIHANVALAEAQIGQAWKLRSSEFANQVSDQQFSAFQEELMKADETLNRMSGKAKDCMAWYSAKQTVGVGLGHSRTEMDKLFEEAIAIEPLYYPVYKQHALYLLPRWHGAPGEWEKFTEQASAKIGGIDGSILYSELCWQMSRYYPGSEFYKQNKVNWLSIKKGFTDRQKKYGASIRYLNAFCLLAGSAGDKTTTRALMARIGDRWERDFWIEKQYFDGYKKWAFE
jgi:hypothetical protein